MDELFFPGMPSLPGISMLIGCDQWWKIMTGQVQQCLNDEKMAAINTSFGCTFQGPIPLQSSFTCGTTMTICKLTVGVFESKQVESTLHSFWDLESVGITGQRDAKNEEHNSV